MISKKILRPLLVTILVFCASMMSSLVSAQVASCVTEIQQENSRWSYVQKNLDKLEKQEAALAGFSSKFGSALDDYAPFISMAVAGAVGTEAGIWGTADCFNKIHRGGGVIPYNIWVMEAAGIAGAIVSGLIIYGLCKGMSKLLQNRPALCKQILIAYTTEWQINKPNTPEALHPIFDLLHAEFLHDANISSVTDQQACQVVEGLLAASVVFAAAN